METARWDGGGKRSWKRGGCKRGGSWGRSSLKMGEGIRNDTMRIGEKWVKYGRVELWERKTGRNRDRNWERSV